MSPESAGEKHRQGEHLRQCGSGLADDDGKLLVSVFLLVLESQEGLRLFDGREILPLQILDQGNLGVVPSNSDSRQNNEARLLGCCITSLAGYDIEPALFCHAEEKGLENAELFNGSGKLREGNGVDHLPGLVRVQFEVRDGLW